MIVRDSKMRLGCPDFAPDFTLRETHDQMANWDVHSARNIADWRPHCAQAFKEAVARARRKFDLPGRSIFLVAFPPPSAAKTP